MNSRNFLLLGAFLIGCTIGKAQVTLENFSSVVNPGYTVFYGTFSSTGLAFPSPSDAPAANMIQNSGYYSFTGSNTTNTDTSLLEIYFTSSLNLTGLGYLALTAEALSTNAASSLRIYLFDTNGFSASAAFAASSFPTGGFSTAIQALTMSGSFNPGAVELMTITGDTSNGTARFNFSFDNLAAVSAIPEPSTYAAILGALALGFAAYRRRQRAA